MRCGQWGIARLTLQLCVVVHSVFALETSAVMVNGSEGEKSPEIVGMRVESDHANNAFVGYSDEKSTAGASIVRPDATVKIVLFGWRLDEVVQIGFAQPSFNCSHVEDPVIKSKFDIHNKNQIAVRSSFPDVDGVYKICIKSSGDAHFTMLDEMRMTLSTKVPPVDSYLPKPIQIAVIAFLLVLSGLFSGLNLGLMALSPQELKLIVLSGSKQERRYAETILPVRQSGNLLLCSLLIGNVCVNSGISILLDDLTGSGATALIASSAGIVVFGEIFPQSVCVKKGLAVGARTIWITRIFMALTFPLAFPISKLLDCLLGDELVTYDRKRLVELIKMAPKETAEEWKIAVGAMEISDKTVEDVMTRIDDVFMLPQRSELNARVVAEILHMGYTRIPVYADSRDNVISLLFVKDLALLDPDDGFTIETVCGFHQRQLRFVLNDTPLRVMLEEFKKGDYHLAMVRQVVNEGVGDPVYKLVGIVTLEDIVEEILQAEIVDETDLVMDNVRRTRRGGGERQRKDLSLLLETDDSPSLISVQMQIVTFQFLTSNFRAFSTDQISQNVLEKLIRQHVKRVELSHISDITDPNAVVPRTAKLYTKNQASDRFILVLEGRVLVTIGQTEDMQFEAGPWHYFGANLLKRMAENAPQAGQSLSQSRGSLTGSGGDGSKRHLPIVFTPDFTAVVRDSCIYLEVTVQDYMLAVKTTLISRGSRAVSLLDDLRHPPHLSGQRNRSGSSTTTQRVHHDHNSKAASHGSLEDQSLLLKRSPLASPQGNCGKQRCDSMGMSDGSAQMITLLQDVAESEQDTFSLN